MTRNSIAYGLALAWLTTLPFAIAVAADPSRGTDANRWLAAERQIAEQIDAEVTADPAAHEVAGGTGSGHGLVRTAVLAGSYGSLPGPHAANGPEFGYSVALNGDLLAVGAPGTVFNNGPGLDGQGVVFQYRRADGGWQLETLLRPAMNALGPRCGHSIALRLPDRRMSLPARAGHRPPP